MSTALATIKALRTEWVARGASSRWTSASGSAQWAWSVNGTLAFVPGGGVNNERALAWFDRSGRVTRTAAPLRAYPMQRSALRISPDGTRVPLTIANATGGTDIWVWDIARPVLTRLSFDGYGGAPVWMPDSRRVCYVRWTTALDCQAADGSGQAPMP